MQTPLQKKIFQYVSKIMGVNHELPSKIASYHEKPRVTSKIKKI